MHAGWSVMLIAAVMLLGVSAGQAGIDVWTSEGPEGAAITVVTVDPTDAQIAYVGTSGGGIFKTIDGGSSWAAARAGLSNASVHRIAIDPSNTTTVYALLTATAVAAGGLFKSIDGGANWAAADEGLVPGFISSLAIDAANPEALYVTIGDHEGAGVFKTIDGAESWQRVLGESPVERTATQVAIDPADSDTVYAALRPGFVKSTNAGETWEPTASWPFTTSAEFISQIAFDAVDTRIIYIAAQGGLLPSGVFKSTDGGDSWEPTGAEVGSRAELLAPHPTVSGTLYAFNATGAFKTTDGGARWEQMIQGLPARRFRYEALALAASEPQRLYFGLGAVAPAPVYRSDDGAATWEPLPVTGLTNTALRWLAVATGDPPARYASADIESLDALFPLWESGTDPQSWTRSTGIENATAIAIDPNDSDVVYAGSTNNGVFKSEDAGGTWRSANANITGTFIRCLEIDPSDTRILYTCSSGGLFKSTTSGMAWISAAEGLQDAGATERAVSSAIAIDPQTPATLYAATLDQGVFKSTDGGQHWDAADQGLSSPGVHTIALGPTHPGVLYAGAVSGRGSQEPGGVFKSTNAGASWTAANGGDALLAAADVVDLAVDPACADIVYAATDVGIWRSLDGASTWTPLNDGLFTRDVRAVVIDPDDPGMLHAATFGGGVFTIQQSFRSGPDACAATPTPEMPTPTPTSVAETPTPGPTDTVVPVPCAGDCDGAGSVRVDELVRAVRIALGLATVDECSPADPDGDGQVRVEELVRAVQRSLQGCAG